MKSSFQKLNLFSIVILISASSYAQNTGIGETNPTMQLHIKTQDSAVLLIHNEVNNAPEMKTGLFFKTGSNFSGSIATIGQAATFRMGLFTYGGNTPAALLERMSIADNGKIGVNIIAPVSRFHIAGLDSNVLTLQNKVPLAPGVTTAMYFKNGDATPTFSGAIKTVGIGTGSARMAFSTFTSSSAGNLEERLTISEAGNVGINTINPGAKLQVNGNVRINDGTQGSGKVFTSDQFGFASWQAPPSSPATNTAFKVFTSGTTAISNAFTEPLLFSTVGNTSGKFDDGNNFDNATNSYIAPSAGVYMFNVTVLFPAGFANQAGYINISPASNGIPASNLPPSSVNLVNGQAFPRNMQLSFITRMDAGDNMTIRIYQTVTPTLTAGSGVTQFTGSRLY